MIAFQLPHALSKRVTHIYVGINFIFKDYATCYVILVYGIQWHAVLGFTVVMGVGLCPSTYIF